MTGWLREGVVGAIGVAGGLSAEGAGLGVELEGDDGGLQDGASGHLDELPDGLLVEGGYFFLLKIIIISLKKVNY